MDQPMQVMMALFIAVTVGISIFMFSQNILQNAQDDLNDDEVDIDNDVIRVSSFSEPRFTRIAEQCMRYFRENTALDEDTCVIIRSDTAGTPSDNVPSQVTTEYGTTAVQGDTTTCTTVFVERDPVTGEILFTC